jgi:hypothetical protein
VSECVIAVQQLDKSQNSRKAEVFRPHQEWLSMKENSPKMTKHNLWKNKTKKGFAQRGKAKNWELGFGEWERKKLKAMYDSKGKQSKILLQSTKDIKPSFHVIIESEVSLSLSLSISTFLVCFSVFLLHSVDLSVSKTTRKCVIKKKTRTEKQKNPETERSFSSLSFPFDL